MSERCILPLPPWRELTPEARLAWQFDGLLTLAQSPLEAMAAPRVIVEVPHPDTLVPVENLSTVVSELMALLVEAGLIADLDAVGDLCVRWADAVCAVRLEPMASVEAAAGIDAGGDQENSFVDGVAGPAPATAAAATMVTM